VTQQQQEHQQQEHQQQQQQVDMVRGANKRLPKNEPSQQQGLFIGCFQNNQLC
jgi:hypothetical protein